MEILEIRLKTKNKSKQDPATVEGTSNIDKQEQYNWNELQTNNNQNTTQQNHTEQTLTQEQEMN